MSDGAGSNGPSFRDLQQRLVETARGLGGALETIGEVEGYPFLRLTFGVPDAPPLLIDAGIHGEEPAASLGLAAWLGTEAPRWIRHLRITALPCLNPWGFERGLRRSRHAEDSNRLFDVADAPLTRLVAAALGDARFGLAMDLHEDCDFLAAYCYELKAGPPFLGDRILAAFGAWGVPLSHGEAVGPFTTEHGWLRPVHDAAALRARQGWPIAFAHLTRSTGHVVTVETPGRQPLDVRIALQGDALTEAAAFAAGLPPHRRSGIE